MKVGEEVIVTNAQLVTSVPIALRAPKIQRRVITAHIKT
jgi:hypothetical protein